MGRGSMGGAACAGTFAGGFRQPGKAGNNSNADTCRGVSPGCCTIFAAMPSFTPKVAGNEVTERHRRSKIKDTRRLHRRMSGSRSWSIRRWRLLTGLSGVCTLPHDAVTQMACETWYLWALQ